MGTHTQYQREKLLMRVGITQVLRTWNLEVGFFRIPGHLKGPEGISQMCEGQVGASQGSPSL